LAISQDVSGMASFDWDLADVSVVSLGNDEADIINNFQTDYDFIELEGPLLRSTVEDNLRIVNIDVGEDDVQGVEASDDTQNFDLSAIEFGLIRSEFSNLSASELDDASLVRDLLDDAFLFGDFGGESSRINTTIFAITAEDNDNVTAIWAHTQSSANDQTVDVFELSLLATVYTRGEEFDLDNFRPEPVRVVGWEPV
jgi:ABC-type iron transport system FetAB ATPase subunit